MYFTKNDKDDGCDPEGAGARIVHNGEDALARAAGAEPVERIGETVDMKAAGEQCEQRCENYGAKHGGQLRADDPIDKDEQSAEEEADEREDSRAAPDLLRLALGAPRPGKNRQELDGGVKIAHAIVPATPADSNVAISRMSLTAASMTPIARHAPVPSPRRIPRSSSGTTPSSCSIARWPLSAETCAAKRKSITPGQSARAISPADPAMKPSTTSGMRKAAAPSIAPAIAPISRPPTLVRTSRASFASGRLMASPFSIAATLRAQPSASIPAPLPAASRGAAPVVLPMPISPTPRRNGCSLAAASSTRRMPASMQASASARVIAGPRVKLSVPRLIFSARSFNSGGKSCATPASMISSSTPNARASALIAAPPERKLYVICAVTACGYALTLSAVTPWSAAKTKIRFGPRRGGTTP